MTGIARHVRLAFLPLLAVVIVFATASRPSPRARAVSGVGRPPANLKLDRFYARHIDAAGLPIVSSGRVPEQALVEAAELVGHMLARRPDIRRAVIEGHVHIAVMARDEVTTDVPEHSQLKPKEYWDQRARGLGGTPYIPTTSCAEENLLGYQDDRYCGENILIHEFSHTVHEVGMDALDSTFDGRLQKLYERAMTKGLWRGTYAATNHKEYWAEGVQSYFDANLRADPPNGVHNHVRTRELLQEYDPDLARFIDEAFARNPWRWNPNGAHQRCWKKHMRWPR